MSDVSSRAFASPVARLFATPAYKALVWIPASAAMMLALMAPALWNGFPLIFPDVGGYLDRPIHATLGMGRSALYGLFLYAGRPLLFWPNALFQSALMLWVVVLTIRAHGLGRRPWLALAIVAMLAVCTSLPWFAGQLMPDIFFPAAVLAIYLICFRRETLARWEYIIVWAVIVLAIPCHMAAAGMCVAIIAALWLLSRFVPKKLARPKLWSAACGVAMGIALCPISNYAITGNFAFTPGGSSFLFGRLIEDGVVARYLEDSCPDDALRLCDFQASLPKEANDWLWNGASPFRKLNWEGQPAEERAVIVATLKRYPLMHAWTAIVAAAKQSFTFQTELDVVNNAPTVLMFRDHFPELFSQFTRARQQTERFDVGPLNYLHVPIAALSIAGLVIVVFFRRRLVFSSEAPALAIVVLLALAANAAICGIFSHPVDRYQSRLVLLAPFALTLLIAQRRSVLAT